MGESYDIAIIGAGPGGYVAAIHAAQAGFKVVCIDKRETPGGTCLNVGCIPSKSFLSSTEFLIELQQEAKHHGIEIKDLAVNFDKMKSRKEKIVSGLVEGINTLFRNHKVKFIKGVASFIDPHRLKVNDDEIEADYIILATGSEAIPLPGMPFDERQIVSSTGALSLRTIPKSMIVIGGGVIGVELASVFSRLGTHVIVVEMLDQICPGIDPSLSRLLLRSLQKQGIEFMLSTQVITSIVQPEEIILTVQQGEHLKNLSTDIVLVAVGRRPYSDQLNLEKIGLQVNKKGFIPIDHAFRTSIPHIFAIGDLIEGAMLAHKASAEGVAVVDLIKGERTELDYLIIPNVIYTNPELATVGLTEKEATELGLEVLTGISYFKANPRARCTDETDGLVKVVGDKKTGRLLGMHIMGPHASELISVGMVALQAKATLRDIAKAPTAHPTLSETIKEAAEAALK